MATFDQFPDDDHLWMVKWVDKIQLPHLSTKSASVEVLLQKLPDILLPSLNRLSEKDIQSLLNVSAFKNPEHFTNPCPRVLAGAIPSIYIGQVYQHKVLVGDIPTIRLPIFLPGGEASCETVTLQEEIPQSLGWDPKFPHRILNPSEFSVPKQSFPHSQCLVFRTKKFTYVIPRAVIFQTYYALHTSMARAFTNGPWPEALKSLIFTGELDSGMKTEIDEQTGVWNLVRQIGVKRELAPLLALYYFDPHARVCAESIYSNALQERGFGAHNPWHISAKIPFQGNTPVSLDVRGFALHSYATLNKNKVSNEHQPTKILITKIIASSFPVVPEIKTAAYVNSLRGSEVTEVDAPPPFSSGVPTPKPPNDATTINNNADAMSEGQPTELVMDTLTWINPPTISTLQKIKSKTYTGKPSSPKPNIDGGDMTSPGNLGYGQNNVSEVRIEIELVRQPEQRFQYLQNALKKLADKEIIARFTVISPPSQLQTIRHSGDSCWNFLDEESRITGKWPKKGWRLVTPSKRLDDGSLKIGQPRAALVIEIEFQDIVGYWIEIESRTGGFRSPFLYNFNCDPLDAVSHCIEIIALHEGKNLDIPLQNGLAEVEGSVRTYMHIYESKDSSEFSIASLTRFFYSIR
ncbi:hypothetical protein AAKU64_000034 [Undibacterium sp. GrIS 1.8]|uniref:hypothetical protein n=1 Tax=Undibacterium sp. GrIS 1.8 TaxID=3143934 RepID=UPI0033923261